MIKISMIYSIYWFHIWKEYTHILTGEKLLKKSAKMWFKTGILFIVNNIHILVAEMDSGVCWSFQHVQWYGMQNPGMQSWTKKEGMGVMLQVCAQACGSVSLIFWKILKMQWCKVVSIVQSVTWCQGIHTPVFRFVFRRGVYSICRGLSG